MNANPVLLQKKYARVVELFTEENYLSLDDALAFFINPKYMSLCGKEVFRQNIACDKLSLT